MTGQNFERTGRTKGSLRKVLIRMPRKVTDEDTGRNVVLNDLEKFYVDPANDFHINRNIVKKEHMLEGGKFNEGKDVFVAFKSIFLDDYKQINRKAQIITLKDLGPIIAYTGINRDSVVIDAGAGSGAVGCFLGGIVREVHEFDIDEKNIEIARENVKMLGLSNVKIEKGDVYDTENFNASAYDVFILDVPEPWRAIETAVKVLKIGGFLVIYAPNITQVQEAILKLPENLLHEKTIEIIEREWSLKDKIVRPVTKDFGHTAFLGFVRKIF